MISGMTPHEKMLYTLDMMKRKKIEEAKKKDAEINRYENETKYKMKKRRGKR